MIDLIPKEPVVRDPEQRIARQWTTRKVERPVHVLAHPGYRRRLWVIVAANIEVWHRDIVAAAKELTRPELGFDESKPQTINVVDRLPDSGGKQGGVDRAENLDITADAVTR